MTNPTTCSSCTMFFLSFIAPLLTTTQSASFISNTVVVSSSSRINSNKLQYPPSSSSSSRLFSSFSSFPSSSSSSSWSSTSSLVLDSLSQLYPPTDIESRNALSRTDGYWKYISKNLEPPLEFTYGEFDFVFFSELLSIAIGYLAPAENNAASPVDVSDKVFIDIGSGTGRLVLGAAALYSWKECRGVEILEGIHQQATTILESCHSDSPSYRYPSGGYYLDNDDNTISPALPLSPITLTQTSFTSPYASILDADIAFVFSSCMSSSILSDLATSLGRQCRPGTLIITTEYTLPLEGIIPPVPSDPSMPHGQYKFELLRQVDGVCDVVGGVSTAYIHRVVESLHVGERVPPEKDQVF